jgi:hypothetical protein
MTFSVFRWLTSFSVLLFAIGLTAGISAQEGLSSSRYLEWGKASTISSRRVDDWQIAETNPLRQNPAPTPAHTPAHTPAFLSVPVAMPHALPGLVAKSAVFRLRSDAGHRTLAEQSTATMEIQSPVFEPRFAASSLMKRPLRPRELPGTRYEKIPLLNSATILNHNKAPEAGPFALFAGELFRTGSWAGQTVTEIYSRLDAEVKRVDRLLSIPAALDPVRYSPFLKALSGNSSTRKGAESEPLRGTELSRPATPGYVISEYAARAEGTAITSANQRKFCFSGKCFVPKAAKSVPVRLASSIVGKSHKGEPVFANAMARRILKCCETVFRSLADFFGPLFRIPISVSLFSLSADFGLKAPAAEDLFLGNSGLAGYVQTGIWIW